MNFQYFNKPKIIHIDRYEYTIKKIVSHFDGIEDVIAIYQLGSVNHPGISDLDIICVIKNDSFYKNNFPYKDYLDVITHGLSGISKKHFLELQKYSLWKNLQIIHGTKISEDLGISTKDNDQLKENTALEYLLKNYIDMKIQIGYGAFNLRSLLQQLKGLKHDFELLNQTNHQVYDLILEFYKIIDNWYNNESLQIFDEWLKSFLNQYFEFVNDTLSNYPIKLPEIIRFPQESHNISLNKTNEKIKMEFNGYRLFKWFYYHKKIFRLNEKLNNYKVRIPIQQSSDNYILNRVNYLFDNYLYVINNLPGFSPQIPSFYNYFTRNINSIESKKNKSSNPA